MGLRETIKKPLRRLYWWYHGKREQQILRKLLRERRRELLTPKGRKAYLIGTPTHENLGDSAIVLAQRAFLLSCGLTPDRIKEITEEEYRRDWDKIKTWIPKDALIAQLGGGHMGNQWPEEERLHRSQVEAFPENAQIIFPQTLYYLPGCEGEAKASSAVYNGKKNLTMAARERVSFETMKKLYPDTQVLLTPDIVLSATMETFGAEPQSRSGVLLCLRGDLERVLEDRDREKMEDLLTARGLSYGFTDMYSPGRVPPEQRQTLVKEKLEELGSAKLVITDRLHGMIFCALMGTPCIVFSNNNPKVLGTYRWISYLPYIRFAAHVEELEGHLEELLKLKDCHFDGGPLKEHYAPLREVVKAYAEH